MYGMPGRACLDLGNRLAGMQGDAPPGKSTGNFRPYIGIKAAQWQIAPIDDMGIHAKAIKDAGKFQRNIAGAIDHDAGRPFGKIQRLVRGDGTIC